MKKLKLHAALLSSVAGVIAILLSAAPAKAEEEKVTLALNWKPEPEFGGFYSAQRSGDYKKNGLAVTIQPGGAGQPTVQMVAAGKAEFGIVSADELVLARSNGANVIALFTVYQTNPQGIMVHASKGLKKIDDVFKAGTLAIQKGLPYSLFLEKKYGFGNIKIVPYSGGIASFLHDPEFAQQCFVTAEPLEAKKQHSDPQSFLIADAGYNPYTAVMITFGDYLKKHPETVTKMVQAVKKGWIDYLENPTATNELMHGLNKTMEVQTFSEGASAQKALIENSDTKKNGIGSMTLARWEELIGQMADLKLMTTRPKASECVWTNALNLNKK